MVWLKCLKIFLNFTFILCETQLVLNLLIVRYQVDIYIILYIILTHSVSPPNIYQQKPCSFSSLPLFCFKKTMFTIDSPSPGPGPACSFEGSEEGERQVRVPEDTPPGIASVV